MSGFKEPIFPRSAPLHLTSHYSLLGIPRKLATSSPEQLVKQAVRLGYTSAALTDTTFTSLGSFIKAGHDEGIKTIPGIELPVYLDTQTAPSYLTFLAENNPGLYLLYQWATAVSVEKKRLTPADIAQRSGDEKIITFWRGQPSHLLEYLDGDSNYYAIDAATTAQRRKSEYIEKHLPHTSVMMHEVKMASIADAPIWKFVSTVYQNIASESDATAPLNLSLKSPLEIASLYSFARSAVERSSEIAERCEVSFPMRPEATAKIAEGQDAPQFLRTLVMSAFESRLINYHDLDVMIERLVYELDMIIELGLTHYVLIAYEIFEFCQEQGIELRVSGSGNNSCVLWALGLVRFDPSSLLFERFINPERVGSLPDIDFLVAADKVAEVMNFLVRRYPGEAARLSVIKRLRKASIVELAEKASYPLAPDVLEAVVAAELPLQTAVHASGIILDHRGPLHRTDAGHVLSQLNKDDAEKGTPRWKYDILAFDGVSHIQKTYDQLPDSVRQTTQGTGDQAVYQKLFSGQTVAITTSETPHLQQVLMDVGAVAECWALDTVAQALALARFGYQTREQYLQPHNQHSLVRSYPELHDILGSTRLVAIYQEQLMKIATQAAGLSLKFADRLRKMMSEKQSPVAKDQILHELVVALQHRGYPQSVVSFLQDQVRQFMSYSFVEGHALALADIAYEQAFLAITYPLEYWVGVLDRLVERSSETAYPLQVYINEILRSGLSFEFPTDGFPSQPIGVGNKIMPSRELLGKKNKAGFPLAYSQFLKKLTPDVPVEELIEFQEANFPVVLTHQPIEKYPKEYHFDPNLDRQEIIAEVALMRASNDRVFVTLDSNQLIHATVTAETLSAARTNHQVHVTREGWYQFDIGRSKYRDTHWIILGVKPITISE